MREAYKNDSDDDRDMIEDVPSNMQSESMESSSSNAQTPAMSMQL